MDQIREHILSLSKDGVGTRSIADAADLDRRTVQCIKYGRAKRAHQSTMLRILGVDRDAVADGALVSAAKTHRLIAELVNGGYTKKWIARRLGYRGAGIPSSLLRARQIQARTASRVERLYRLIMAGRVAR